jgi:hypothetical protein
VTSLQFSQFDPIGSFLVSYDNGVVKTWQSSVRNEQFLKLLEIQQHHNSGSSLPQFDMSECGYQQFDIIDVFNMFENPHGLDEISEEEKSQLRLLYQVIITSFVFYSFIEQALPALLRQVLPCEVVSGPILQLRLRTIVYLRSQLCAGSDS